ncbi:MAG: steroid-24-oyl-CoA synthetase, partial [Actinomycetota bacterium]|nr:steroid-24-oyl-CoA synthetase [Actinomycetota bacterium]
MTTLVWPSEAVPNTVLESLTGPGAPFELREEDVLGAPMLVMANRPKTLIDLLHGAAERMGDRPYVIFPDREHTFASILQPIASVAAGLRDQYGIEPGDRVAIVAPNTIEYALLFWATTALGAITVGLNGWWTGEEIAYAVELTEPKVLFGDRRRVERLAGIALPPGMPVVEFERDFAELERHAPDAPFPDVAIDEDDPFVILFTSGTTGRPKGVMLSHRSNIHFLMASMLNGAVAMMTDMENGVPVAPPPERSVIISAAPMFHIAGLNCQLVAATLMGNAIVYP